MSEEALKAAGLVLYDQISDHRHILAAVIPPKGYFIA